MAKWHKALRLLRHDPALFLETVRARIRGLNQGAGEVHVQRRNGIGFEFDPDLDPAVSAMVAGAYEIPTVALLRRTLKPGDVFVDVGANIGYMSFVALGCVGPAGQVHAFEPVPAYAARLRRLMELNPEAPLHIQQHALGDAEGRARIDVSSVHNVGWNTMVPGFMKEDGVSESVEIRVRRLDAYLSDAGVEKVTLVKIDTEGYELPVLRGLSGYLERTAEKPRIICEVAPAAYPLLGLGLSDLAEELDRQGYEARAILRPHDHLDVQSLTTTANVLLTPTS